MRVHHKRASCLNRHCLNEPIYVRNLLLQVTSRQGCAIGFQNRLLCFMLGFSISVKQESFRHRRRLVSVNDVVISDCYVNCARQDQTPHPLLQTRVNDILST